MNYLKTFFEEKDLPYVAWEIEHNGEMHFIDTEVVIEAILNAPEHEKEKISDMIRRIDFVNGNVVNYLHFLAGALIRTRAGQ